MKALRVLVVNKEDAFPVIFERMIGLLFTKIAVVSARSMENAIDMIKSVKFDVLITELFFTSGVFWAQNGISLSDTAPEGIDVLRYAREIDIPVRIVTSIICSSTTIPKRSEIGLGEIAYQNGAHCVLEGSDIFEKPDFLAKVIGSLLERRIA
jgi:hypothetical protein